MAGNDASALDEFRKSVDMNSQNAQALNNLAYMLADFANKLDEALPYAEKARELDPTKPEYAGTLGWILYRKGIYLSAVKQMELVGSKDLQALGWPVHLELLFDFRSPRRNIAEEAVAPRTWYGRIPLGVPGPGARHSGQFGDIPHRHYTSPDRLLFDNYPT